MEPSASSSAAFSQSASVGTSASSLTQCMPSHDIVAFGVSRDFRAINLATHYEILQYYFFLSDHIKKYSRMFSYKSFTPRVADKLIEVWSKLNIEIINRKTVVQKLNALIDKYHKENKNRTKEPQKFIAFVRSIKRIFFIAKCKCDLKQSQCSCGLIPTHLKEFMLDQHNERKRIQYRNTHQKFQNKYLQQYRQFHQVAMIQRMYQISQK